MLLASIPEEMNHREKKKKELTTEITENTERKKRESFVVLSIYNSMWLAKREKIIK